MIYHSIVTIPQGASSQTLNLEKILKSGFPNCYVESLPANTTEQQKYYVADYAPPDQIGKYFESLKLDRGNIKIKVEQTTPLRDIVPFYRQKGI
ncbi:MAG: hypothetical protein AABX72_03890 [Nanoarchaeota archaeon]